jgi:hypothetical protein
MNGGILRLVNAYENLTPEKKAAYAKLVAVLKAPRRRR